MQSSPELSSFILERTGGRFVVPIGRLDKFSHGLLLLTTDESICAKLLRPSATPEGSVIQKEYHVKTFQNVKESHLENFRSGIQIKVRKFNKPRDIVTTKPCIVERIDGSKTLTSFILREGKNRQLRKMFGSIGIRITDLKRVRFGPITLGRLQVGQAEQLSDEEVALLVRLGEKKGVVDKINGTGEVEINSPTPNEDIVKKAAKS
jgi:pseudouridine synthase